MKPIPKTIEQSLTKWITPLGEAEKIDAINQLKKMLHELSPLKHHPVDCVLWLKTGKLHSNDYNPNSVAPPEMQLLRLSIHQDGYTQPIVSFEEGNDSYEVVDGFHRTRVAKECPEVSQSTLGYVPCVVINAERADKADRIASTIRHNRARGKHAVNAMSEIVIDLKARNWSNERIAKSLGMDADEILRLCQITGLTTLFQDQEFSKSWDIKDAEMGEFEGLSDQISDEEKETHKFRTVNTGDEGRIFHTFDLWECHKAGFYKNTHSTLNREECELKYCQLLADSKKFGAALSGVITEWKHSCEHYLTNKAMNRIAWLGQAALCYAEGIPSAFRGGFNLLPDDKQKEANLLALEYLNKWLAATGRETVELDEAMPEREATIY